MAEVESGKARVVYVEGVLKSEDEAVPDGINTDKVVGAEVTSAFKVKQAVEGTVQELQMSA